MPKLLIILDYEALHKEILTWRANHRGMTPYIIVNKDTLSLMGDEAERTWVRAAALNEQTYSSNGTVIKLFGCDIALCENLALGEFKVR